MCFGKIIPILTLVTFLSINIIYAAPSSRSVFKNKKVDYKKISTEQAEAMDKKKAVLQGESVDKEKEIHQKKEVQRILSSHIGDLSQIHIPQEIGRVIEVYEAPGSRLQTQGENRLIVHIQDLHTNPEGEFNLAKILEILLKDYNLGLVCSEGADGLVDTSSVSSFPDQGVREKVAKLFINSGELTGEEYLSITKYPDMPIWGIENKEVYFKNIEEFNKIMKFNSDSHVFISQAKKSLDELKPKIYSKEILSIDQKEADYADQKVETTDYLKYLSSYIQKLNIPTANYKNVALLNETIIQESKIDQQKIMQESQNLLINLQSVIAGNSNRADMDTLMAKASLFKDQKISPFSFYGYLKDLADKHLKDQISKYPNLMDFVDYLTKVNSLDSTKLFVEMEDLTYEIKQTLARNDEEKTLTQALRNIKFLEGFFNLKISNEDLDYYMQNKDAHKIGFFESFLKPAINKYNLTNFIDFNPNLIDAHLREIEDFYSTVKQRDLAMFNNTVSEVEKRSVKVAAFISGGFHTKGVTRLLKDKGYSYIVISPYSKTDIDEENYHFLLSGKRKPIEELIKQLDVPQAASNLSSQKLRVPIAVKYNQQRIEKAIEKTTGEGDVGRGSVWGALNTFARLGIKAGDEITVLDIQPERLKDAGKAWSESSVRREFTDAENLGIIKRTGTKDERGREVFEVLVSLTNEQLKALPDNVRIMLDRGRIIDEEIGGIVRAINRVTENKIKQEEVQLRPILTRLKNENAISQLDSPDALYGKSFEEVMALNPQWARSGFEIDKKGNKINRLGWILENLKWLLRNPDKIQQVLDDAKEIRAKYRYVIFCGMGGSGLSVQTVKTTFGEPENLTIYSLRTTDPAVIKDILEDIAKKEGSLETALQYTYVVPISKSGTTRETVSHKEYFEGNKDKNVKGLFEELGLSIEGHMLVITDKGSPMDTGKHQQREIQLNGKEDIGGRLTSPTTNIFLLPLALVAPEKVKVVLEKARAMNEIGNIDNDTFIRLGAYLYHMAAEVGKDKVTFMVPKELQDLPMWSEQLVEESLGKGGKGVTVFYGEDISEASLRDVEKNDRVFLRINIGGKKTNDELWKRLEKNGYPIFEINVDDIDSIGGIMLGLQRAVATVGYLWDICFVDQPAVEGYKNATREVMSKFQPGERVEVPRDWRSASFGKLKLYYDRLMQVGAITEKELETEVQQLGATMDDAAAVYAAIINILKLKPGFEAKELTSYGRMTEGMKDILQRARTSIFTDGLKMPSKFGEGPDKNHSYHQNIEAGKDMWLSTYLMPLQIEQPEVLPYDDNLIRAQTIGTVNSIAKEGRKVMLITFDSITKDAEGDVELFFEKVSGYLNTAPKPRSLGAAAVGFTAETAAAQGLIELAKSSRKQQVDSMDQIIAIDAAKVISDEKGFENWITGQPENIAVVIIAMSDAEYESVKRYENIAFIKVFGRDIKGDENRLALVTMFSEFGAPEFFGGFKLGVPGVIDQYKTVAGAIAEGI